MVGGIWQIRRRDARRMVVSTMRHCASTLGGRRFGAILRGDNDGGFAAAPA